MLTILTTGVTDTAADAALKDDENPNGPGAVFDSELVARCTQLLVAYQTELTKIWNEPAFVNEQVANSTNRQEPMAPQLPSHTLTSTPPSP